MTEFRALAREETAAAARVLAEGMADLPLHVKVFGPHRQTRCRMLESLFMQRLAMSWCPPECAVVAGTVAGVCAIAPPGACCLSWVQRKRLEINLRAHVPELFQPQIAESFAQWSAQWAAADPQERHWHIGPLAVAPELQRRGLGRGIMQRVVARLDEANCMGFLETDLERDVTFYKYFDFEVVSEVSVLGVATWFMRRPPASFAPPAGCRRT